MVAKARAARRIRDLWGPRTTALFIVSPGCNLGMALVRQWPPRRKQGEARP